MRAQETVKERVPMKLKYKNTIVRGVVIDSRIPKVRPLASLVLLINSGYDSWPMGSTSLF